MFTPGITRSTRVFAGVVLLAGCGGPGADAAPAADSTSAGSGSGAVAERRAETPFQSPPGFALPFHTRIPVGLRAAPDTAGRGDAMHWVWEADPRAFVHLFIAPPGQSEDAIREVVRTSAEQYGVPGVSTLEPAERRHAWALVEYPFRSRGTTRETLAGWVALGQHGGRWFHILVQYPVELEAQFAPRAEQVLSEWRWADGSGLHAPAAASSASPAATRTAR